jgi:hypothetical protein
VAWSVSSIYCTFWSRTLFEAWPTALVGNASLPYHVLPIVGHVLSSSSSQNGITDAVPH